MSVEDQKVLELEQRKEKIYFGGGTKAIEKQKAMGKMTARERIIALLDEGSFHEYDMFVEHDGRDFGMQDKSLPGDGVIIGTGMICGQPIAILHRTLPWPAARSASCTPVKSRRSWTMR